MRYIVLVFFCLVFTLISCKKEGGADKSEHSPIVKKVEFGRINVGQSETLQLKIKNTSKIEMLVKSYAACCGNPVPKIDKEIILPKETLTLSQEINRRKAGAFKITTRIVFSQPENLIQKYEITGVAIQPVTAKIGWTNTPLTEVNFEDDVRLPEIHNSGKNLILNLRHDTDMSFLTERKFNLTSKYFSHLDTVSNVDNKQQPDDESYQMILTPLVKFPIGEICDDLTIEFVDQTKCVIPLVFRSLGDFYFEKPSLSLGSIGNSTISKEIKLYFHENTPVCDKPEYSIKGKLSDAVKIVSQTAMKNYLELIIEIKRKIKGSDTF